jgi:hypothetical protein
MGLGCSDGILAEAYHADMERAEWEPQITKEIIEKTSHTIFIKEPRCTGECSICGSVTYATTYDAIWYYNVCQNCGYVTKRAFTSKDQRKFITRKEEQ